MKKVWWVVPAVLLIGIFAFSGCKESGTAAALKQQIDDLTSQLNNMNAEFAKLQTRVDKLEKTINDLKTNHPELFQTEQQTQEQAQQGTQQNVSQEGKTKKSTKKAKPATSKKKKNVRRKM